MRPLLKLYQTQVDKLTNRAKSGEQAFMNLYGQITKVPDFGLAVEKAEDLAEKVKRTIKLELENQKLMRELEEFRRDFEEIKNQEVTVRRLEDQIRRYEEDMEKTIESRISDAERRLNDELAAKVIIQKERENELVQQTLKAQEDARLAQQQLEVSQTQKSSTEARLGAFRSEPGNLAVCLTPSGLVVELQAKQASIDMLTNDLDRMTTVIADLEKEVVRTTTLPSRSPSLILLFAFRS